MFTGLVESLAAVADVVPEPPGVRLVIREPRIAAEAAIGDSIALNGCCLTVVAIDGDRLVVPSRRRNALAHQPRRAQAGDSVNVERSLKMGDAIGGHLVSGHIDAVGVVDRRVDDAEWCTMWFRVPPALTQPNGEQRLDRGRRREPHAGRRRGRPLQRRPHSAHAFASPHLAAARSATASISKPTSSPNTSNGNSRNRSAIHENC